MSTLRPSNASPADSNPDVENTIHVEPAAGDMTLRPAKDSTDHSAAMDTTMRTVGHDDPDFQDAAGDFFVLKGVKYKNKQCLSENSGEAQVYLVERDGEEYVLKIYYPTFNINKKMLKTIHNFKFEMIVSLIDYGKVYVDGKSRNYELMEYLRGGTLTDYHLNGDLNQFRRIALQAAAALAYCHSNNILHKDIKPSNLFFRDMEHTELMQVEQQLI